ncbi:nucleoside/nucleotide kinase family protein [Jatrophihabitans sp. YIM 134969]
MPDLDELVQRATELASEGERRLLGVTGAPGAGKSTVTSAIVDALGPDRAVVVPMDGFHLADPVLVALGRRDRKGAPDTFDVDGYLHLLQRLCGATDVVYAPVFRRELELAEAGAIAVDPAVTLVVTEGNYLLTWPAVRDVLDETWYLDVPDAERQRRLVERRRGYGEDADTARRWATGSDQRNADLVATTRHLADLVVSDRPRTGSASVQATLVEADRDRAVYDLVGEPTEPALRVAVWIDARGRYRSDPHPDVDTRRFLRAGLAGAAGRRAETGEWPARFTRHSC